MLDVRDLSFGYTKREVLKGVNLHVESGELVFLLGSNGAGKTTMFKCILGLLHGYGGDIAVDGRSTHEMTPKELAGEIAFIPQNHSNVFEFTVLEMVLMGTNHRLNAFSSPGREEKRIAMDALEQIGIAEFAQRSYQRLSGGEQQLVLVARALAQQTKILLMDEPTASLDYGNQLKVLDKVADLTKDGYTILLSCHNPQQSLLYAERIVALHDGVIAADGHPETVLNADLLRMIYGVNTRFVHTEYGTLIARTREDRRLGTP